VFNCTVIPLYFQTVLAKNDFLSQGKFFYYLLIKLFSVVLLIVAAHAFEKFGNNFYNTVS